VHARPLRGFVARCQTSKTYRNYEFDVMLFQIYIEIYVPIITTISEDFKMLSSQKKDAVFLPHSDVMCDMYEIPP